ncbi:tetratricopeptide repeat protein [Tundrisphaera lichenicola]|uniref:tetratricopeptide repeat protein n=1 Tax=Tundrisphaera lichenicola TaxID=2029860 RepID=UPI003EBFE89D
MKVAFHLRRRSEPEPASAVLLETTRFESVLDLAGRVGQDQLPAIYRLAGGFLVKLGGDSESPIGPIRLRRLAENLYLPVDADLVPALLADEARGLTRELGLVFLPGGRILGFDPEAALSVASMVEAPRFEGPPWRAFPDRPDRADRIVQITLEPLPGQKPDDPLAAVAESTGIGTEGPSRPEDAGAASTLVGRAAVGAGKGLIGLGSALGIKGLADLGARWIGRAVERVPRLTEAMLGRQEGALRELLRQFREGDVDQALRHALPLGGQGGRGSLPSGEGKLPTIDPTYSLQSLLGSGRGPGGIWFGGYDVQIELAREYRKAAEQAERRGDYRRAAYIHGRLLNDYTTAAHLLARGGLHRDAAILYRDRVRDLPAAARSFEAAGEVDRALELYRGLGLHAEAGDLLRRIGEDEASVREYLIAADLLARSSRQGRRAAGDLLLERAGRPDLALEQYALGWLDRPSGLAVACALRMADCFAERGDSPAILKLIDEADELFRRPGQGGQVGEFYNVMATLADLGPLAGARDEIRDRALMGLASRLRESVSTAGRPGPLASVYFGWSQAWPVELVNDVSQAVKAAEERRRLDRSASIAHRPSQGRRIELGEGVVSAIGHASTPDAFIGFESGVICHVDFGRGVSDILPGEQEVISSMSVDPDGQSVVVLAGEGAGPRRLIQYLRSPEGSGGWNRQARLIDGPGEFWLTPMMASGPGRYMGLWNGEEMLLIGGVGALSILARLPMTFLKSEPGAGLLLAGRAGDPPSWTILIHDFSDVCHVDAVGRVLRRRFLGWQPTLREGQTLRSVPLDWLRIDSERVELAGLDRDGVACWSSLLITETELIRTSNNLSMGASSYSATSLVRPGLLAAVGPSGIDWFRCGTQSFTVVGSSGPASDSPVACFPSHRTGELVVVSRDGSLTCVPIPR